RFAAATNPATASSSLALHAALPTFPATNFPADGSYTVSASATDRAANNGTSASNSFKYDTTNPAVSFSFPADSGNYNASGWSGGAPNASTANDRTSGIADAGSIKQT